MAPVLQCPDCGKKHPLASVPAQGAFPCQGCGRVLKVPEAARKRAAAPPVAVQPAAGAKPATVPTPIAAPVPAPVPVATAVARPAPPGVPAPVVDPNATRVVPEVDGKALGALSPRARRRPVPRLGPVPWWMRLLLWFVAVPASFVFVFLIARALSVFTTNQVSDLFLANDTARFWPVARLLPFVALMTAVFVQAGVYVLARLRGRSRRARSRRDLSASTSRRQGR